MNTSIPQKQEKKEGMHTKSYKKWLARVRDTKTPWTENEIIYFRKAIARGDMDYRVALRLEFGDYSGDTGYKITKEQSEKGRNYLLTNSLKKDGTKRKGCKLGERELDILRNLKEHRLVGLFENSGLHNPYTYTLPIYRAIARNGEYFEYIGTKYDQLEIVA